MMKKPLSLIVIVSFFLTSLTPYPQAHADTLNLPAPGTMINLSPAYQPVIIKGLTVHKDNPFLFDFIVDVGQDNMSGEALKKEGEKLIKYFLASLAVPDRDLWVNLSPYEKNKMIPEALGQTDMGRDLLEQDYILKQITASLIYPEKQLGKSFWDRVYSKTEAMYGTTQIPVDTFNKVWIMADRAEVFERNQTAFVVDQHLKVMLEEDYLALQKHSINPTSSFPYTSLGNTNKTHSVASQIVREIVLPELEKEVNTGKNFANLRQIFNSVILSSWYKQNLKEALLNQVYADKSKVKGINLNDPTIKEQIYQQYLKAYKKGVFNYIKDDVNTAGETIPRKYFSGGTDLEITPRVTTDEAMLVDSLPGRQMVDINAGLQTERPDAAMLAVNQLLEISIRASQRLIESGLRGAYGQVEAILADDKLDSVRKLDEVRALFTKFHSITGLIDFQKALDALAPLSSSDAIDAKMKALFLNSIKDGADVYARDVFIASIKESGYIYIARLSEGKGRDEVPAIEAGQVIAPDELTGGDVIAAIKAADRRGDSSFTWGEKIYPIVHGIVDVIEGTNAYAILSFGETPEMLSTINPNISGAMHFSVVGQAVNKIGNLPDSYGAGIATNVGPEHVNEFYGTTVTVDGVNFSIADIELYARHPEQIRALLEFLAKIRGQSLGELKERVVLMNRPREKALLGELQKLKSAEIPGLDIVQIQDGTVIPALQAMIPVDIVARLAGRPVEEITPSMFIGIAGGPEMQSKLAIAAGLQRLGAVGSARVFDNNVGKSAPDADGKRAELGNYDNRYGFGSKARTEMVRLREERGDTDAEDILAGNKLVLARDLPQDAVGIFPVLSNTATFGGIAAATNDSINTLIINAQEGQEPQISIEPVKFADAAMAASQNGLPDVDMNNFKIKRGWGAKVRSYIGSTKLITSKELEVMARLTQKYAPRFKARLVARDLKQAAVDRGEEEFGFMAPDTIVPDAYGDTLTSEEIHTKDWHVDPVPEPLTRPGAIITGPWATFKWAMNALSSGAVRLFWDREDAGWDKDVEGLKAQQVAKDIINGNVTSYEDPDTHKLYTVPADRAKWPVITFRPRGIHMDSKFFQYDTLSTPGFIEDVVTYVGANRKALLAGQDGINIVVAKLQTAGEVKDAVEAVMDIEKEYGLPMGTIKIILMVETIELTLELEEALWVGRHHIVVLNVGRYDKGASDIRIRAAAKLWDKLAPGLRRAADDNSDIPDPELVGVDAPHMKAYIRRTSDISIRRGAEIEGGMFALMKSRGVYPDVDRQVSEMVTKDKTVERDEYGMKFAWSASPAVVPEINAVFQSGNYSNRKAQPYGYTEADRDNLIRLPPLKGTGTRAGVKRALYYELAYAIGQRTAGGAVAILLAHRGPGWRAMQDFAIFKQFYFWTWYKVYHQQKLADEDTVVNREFISKMLDEIILEIQNMPEANKFSDIDWYAVRQEIYLLNTSPRLLWESNVMNDVIDDNTKSAIDRKLGAIRQAAVADAAMLAKEYHSVAELRNAVAQDELSRTERVRLLLHNGKADDVTLGEGLAGDIITSIDRHESAAEGMWRANKIVLVGNNNGNGEVQRLTMSRAWRTKIGRDEVDMPTLQALLDSAGHQDVRSYLQSAMARRSRIDRREARRGGGAVDKAALANPPGGIDLNTANGMQWKISKDGNGVEMNINPAMIARFKREGVDWLSPVIFKMTPVSSVWPLVGLQAPGPQEHLASA